MPQPVAAPNPTSPIASEAEAAEVAAQIARLMSELCDLVEQETLLVRSGRLFSAAAITPRKSELAGAFLNQATRVQASTRYLAGTTPQLLEALRAQHDQFRAKLQTNLTVLATARAVSEGILKGVSNELSRRAVPRTYGATGRYQVAGRRTATPIAISRTL